MLPVCAHVDADAIGGQADSQSRSPGTLDRDASERLIEIIAMGILQIDAICVPH